MEKPITRLGVRREPFFGGRFDFLLWQRHNGQTFVGQPVVMVEHSPDVVAPETPTLSLSPDEAVALMDELWQAGVRPTDIGTAGQLAATQAHLQDMRALVFKTPPKS